MEPIIQTFTGRYVNVLDPDPDTINIEDIAHALSNLCRFSGHVYRFYSVAEHSLNVARILPNELQMCGLLHDASEAYLVDIATPVKSILPDYKRVESNLQKAIAKKFGVPYPFPKEVHEADRAALVTEAHTLMRIHDGHWVFRPEYRSELDLDDKYIVGYLPHVMEPLFLLRYNKILKGEYIEYQTDDGRDDHVSEVHSHLEVRPLLERIRS